MESCPSESVLGALRRIVLRGRKVGIATSCFAHTVSRFDYWDRVLTKVRSAKNCLLSHDYHSRHRHSDTTLHGIRDAEELNFLHLRCLKQRFAAPKERTVEFPRPFF